MTQTCVAQESQESASQQSSSKFRDLS